MGKELKYEWGVVDQRGFLSEDMCGRLQRGGIVNYLKTPCPYRKDIKIGSYNCTKNCVNFKGINKQKQIVTCSGEYKDNEKSGG